MKAHMRTAITNWLIVGSIIFAAGCTGKKDETASAPATASTPAAAVEEAKPADPWEGTVSIRPVFPTKAFSEEAKLDYLTFDFNGDGIQITPFPPHLGKDVEFKLVDSSIGYTLKAERVDCAYKLKVNYGQDQEVLLDPKLGQTVEIEPTTFSGAGELAIRLGLEPDAKNNWSCSLLVTPKLTAQS